MYIGALHMLIVREVETAIKQLSAVVSVGTDETQSTPTVQ